MMWFKIVVTIWYGLGILFATLRSFSEEDPVYMLDPIIEILLLIGTWTLL